MTTKHKVIILFAAVCLLSFIFPRPALTSNFQGAGSSETGSTSNNSSGSESNSSNSQMTMSEARQQAEAEIAQPPEVIDVTDSALVYSRLRPYVDKWRQTLSVPTNEWGIDISSPVVVSSTRPDVVPAELMTFIIGELSKDNMAAAFGVEEVARTRSLLNEQRREAVENRAEEIFNEANSHSESSNGSSSGNERDSSGSSNDSSNDNSSNDQDSPSQIDPTPVTSDSDNLAGIDQDLDGQPDGIDSDQSSDHRSVKKDQRASFLLDEGKTRVMNYLSPKLSNRSAIVKRLEDNGDNTVYLYLSNEGDGEGAGYSPYNDGRFGEVLNDVKSQSMVYALKPFQDAGLDIVFWLRADDSPGFNNQLSDEEQMKFQEDMVNVFGEYASSWVIGLEVDEYFSEEQVAKFVKHMKSITNKPVGIHCTTLDKYSWAISSGADVFYGQYGFGCTPDEISAKTKDVIEKLGGKADFIAAEYHLSSDTAEAKSLGQAAMEAGAAGTGNGR